MKTSLARIYIQNSFCSNCIHTIKEKITNRVEGMSQIQLYPLESLIVFPFNAANQISEMINTLIDIGCYPVGETDPKSLFEITYCSCKLRAEGQTYC